MTFSSGYRECVPAHIKNLTEGFDETSMQPAQSTEALIYNCSAALQQPDLVLINQLNSPTFEFHKHFCKGLCHVFVSRWKSCVERWRKATFWESWENVSGDRGECLCLKARRRSGYWMFMFIRRAASLSCLGSWIGKVLEPFHLPLAHKNRKDSLSEEWVAEKNGEKKKKCK